VSHCRKSILRWTSDNLVVNRKTFCESGPRSVQRIATSPEKVSYSHRYCVVSVGRATNGLDHRRCYIHSRYCYALCFWFTTIERTVPTVSRPSRGDATYLPPAKSLARVLSMPARQHTGTGIFGDQLGPDLQNILRQSYDYLTIMPKWRSTYEGRLIYKTSYEELEAFLGHDSPATL